MIASIFVLGLAIWALVFLLRQFANRGSLSPQLVDGLAVLAVLVTLGMILRPPLVQFFATVRELRQFPPPGQRIKLNGHRLHLHVMGQGPVTVIFEAGATGCSLDWSLVQREVAQFARVCTYDRAGYGWSDPGPRPRTSAQIVAELRTLLHRASVPGPYVLVGHSDGGYHVRLFASRYPDEVAGLVLVDPAHEDPEGRLVPSMAFPNKPFIQGLKAMAITARLGLIRLDKRADRLLLLQSFEQLPADIQEVRWALMTLPKAFRAAYDELSVLPESALQVSAADPLPDVPLVVLTADAHDPAGLPPDFPLEGFETVWRELQAELAGRVPRGKQVIVEESCSSFIHLNRPDAVIEAIRMVIQETRQ